jgi:hypothetical protein
MTDLMWIDPGKSTGVALGRFSDDTPYELIRAWQIPGGVRGFTEWWYAHAGLHPEIRGCEKFTPRQNKGHNLTMAAVEPLRVEGWLVGEGYIEDYVEGTKQPVWQHPPAMYFSSPNRLPVEEKKKRMHAWLKATGELYVTGKTVGQKNADDARSAMAHSIAYMRGIRHMPTLRHYFKED